MAGSRALATRCPACGTVFRVVPDQLRVSDGWVRCGRCAEVFNAPETLVDMDTGARQRLPETERQTLVAAPASAADITTGLADVPANDAEAWTPHALPSEQPVTPLSSEEARHAQADEPDNAGKPELDFGADPPTAEPGAEQGALPDPRAEPEDGPPPSFVRRAEQAARWRQPRVRLALGAGAAVAALALAAQVVYTYRDLAAARWPSTRPALEQACAALRCDIGAPRLVAGLAVQSSGLSRVETSDQYRLAMTLRNQADSDLALPAIELSLTDTQGRLISRRVLRLAELGPTPDRLAAGREVVLQATLQVATVPASEPVAGYTIELFYP